VESEIPLSNSQIPELPELKDANHAYYPRAALSFRIGFVKPLLNRGSDRAK